MSNEYLSVEQVAEHLGLKKKKVYELIKSGALAAVWFGPRQTRVSREAIAEMIELSARKPT